MTRTFWIMRNQGGLYIDLGTNPPRRAQIEPGWHAWISYAVDKPPTEDALIRYQRRVWEDKDAKTIQNYTQTRGAYKPYSTYVYRRLKCDVPNC